MQRGKNRGQCVGCEQSWGSRRSTGREQSEGCEQGKDCKHGKDCKQGRDYKQGRDCRPSEDRKQSKDCKPNEYRKQGRNCKPSEYRKQSGPSSCEGGPFLFVHLGMTLLAKQHTFQDFENRANWAFDKLTYISTRQMYVNSARWPPFPTRLDLKVIPERVAQ